MTLINIGNRIRELRKERGISAKEIAVTLGVSSSFISGIEKGTNKCSLENLDKICTVLGVSLAEFFADRNPELSPELLQVLEKTKKLSPRQLQVLSTVLDEWKIEEYSQPEEINRSKQCTQEDDIDLYNIVLVAEAEGREEMRALSPELQAIVKDAIKVSRQRRKEEKKGK